MGEETFKLPQPWQLAGELVHVYHEYNVPLTGLLRAAEGDHFLFDCVAGHDTAAHVWVYAPVSPADVKELEGSSDLDTGLEQAFTSKHVLALFADNRGARFGADLYWVGGTRLELARAAIDALLRDLAVASGHLQDLRSDATALAKIG